MFNNKYKKIKYTLFHEDGEEAFQKDITRLSTIIQVFIVEEFKAINKRKENGTLVNSKLLSFLSLPTIGVITSQKLLEDYNNIMTPTEKYRLPIRINQLYSYICTIISPMSISVLKGRFYNQLIEYHNIDKKRIGDIEVIYPHIFIDIVIQNVYKYIQSIKTK